MSKFIIVEGSEGVGKSTQIKTIKSFLEEHKIEYTLKYFKISDTLCK